jgi:hypothetical protein
MPCDIKLDGERVLVEATDLMLVSEERRKAPGERRALVHGFDDDLVLNYAGDYPGGVTIRGRVTASERLFVGHKPAPPPAAAPIDGRTAVRVARDFVGSEYLPSIAAVDPFKHLEKKVEMPVDVLKELLTLRQAVLELRDRVAKLEGR